MGNRCIMNIRSALLAVSCLALFISGALLAKDIISTGYLNNNAIGSHDVVSYHSQGEAQKGSERFVFKWKNADWHFASAEQRDLFAKNPEKYTPAYNGFCSNALTLDEGLIRTDGSVWHIFGDQLHLFFAERGRVRWVNGDYEDLKAQADAAWELETASN